MSFQTKLKRWQGYIKKSKLDVYENPDDIKTYKDWLNSGYWFNIKKRYFRKNRRQCKKCGSLENINLHHTDYGSMFYGRLEKLTPLCRNCHVKEHRRVKEIPSSYKGKKYLNPYREPKSLAKYIKENPQGVFTRKV